MSASLTTDYRRDDVMPSEIKLGEIPDYFQETTQKEVEHFYQTNHAFVQ